MRWLGTRNVHALSSRIGAISESFFEEVNKIEIVLPATTSNLGPGFDAFGLALDITNRVVVTRADAFSMQIHGEGCDTIDTTEQNIIVQMTKKAFGLMGKPMPPLRFECYNAVPPSRGLGGSSSAIVAGLAAGLAFCGKELYTPATKKLLLNLAASEEFGDTKRMRHARIAPSIYGGFQISFAGQTFKSGVTHWITQRVAVPPGLQCVLFTPDAEASTSLVRDVLPESLTYGETVFNIARASMLVNCFATGQFDPLRYAMEDRLHQQYRSRELFPHCEPIIAAVLKAGAHGAFLSGAGPTVVAITGGTGKADVASDTMSQFLAEAVSKAATEAAAQHGISGYVHVASPSATGLKSAGWAADGKNLWKE